MGSPVFDAARERERLREIETLLLTDGRARIVARPADDGDGVRILVASRDDETRRTNSLSVQVTRETAEGLIRDLASCAGLPEPW